MSALPPEGPTVTIPLADYERLLAAAESDRDIEWCDVCGAWIDCNDPARASADDFTGCWKMATGRAQDDHLCRDYRTVRQLVLAEHHRSPLVRAVLGLFPEKGGELPVSTIQATIQADMAGVTEKAVSNALAYLTRRKHLRRVGYGRYATS